MLDFLQQLFENLLFGPDLGIQVEYAIAPVLAALAGGAIVGGGLNYVLGGKQRRRLRDRAQNIDADRADAQEDLDEQITGVLGRAEDIDTDQSTEELYGESIQTLQDRIQGGQATAGRQLMRSVMAGGGDVTGSIQSTLGKLTEQSNKSIVDVMNEYNERTQRQNLQQEQRQDQLVTRAMGARQNQFAALSGMAEQAYSRSAQKSTADKQMFMDALGTGANIAAMGV